MSPIERQTYLAEAANRGLTLEQIGASLGVTRERARQLLNREGLNEDRLAVKRAKADQMRRQGAMGKVKPKHQAVVELLQRNGLPVVTQIVPASGDAYRMAIYLGGKEMVIRTANRPCLTNPRGPSYWRGGAVYDRDSPHVLVTPTDVYVWLPHIRVRYLYVRDRNHVLSRFGRPISIDPPDFSFPLQE